jgi:hypothetical protein
VHDYLTFNPSRLDILAKREANTKRIADWRRKRASNDTEEQVGNDVGNAVTNTATNNVGNGVSNAAPVPSRPVPARKKEKGAGQARGVSKGRAAKGEPMPFTIAQAMDAIRHGVLVDPFPREPKYATNLTALIRAYPNLDEWRSLADFLAAGGAGQKSKPNLGLFIACFGAWRQQQAAEGTPGAMHNDAPPGDEDPFEDIRAMIGDRRRPNA